MSEHTQKHTDERRIDYLITTLFSDDTLTAEAQDALCRWLTDEKEAESKTKALGRYFSTGAGASKGKSNLKSLYADELWPGIAGRIGMNTDLDVYRRLRAARTAKKAPLGRRILWRAAAVLVPMLLAGGGYFWYEAAREMSESPNVTASLSDVYTPEQIVEPQTDSLRTILLPDGTEVTLNRNSTFSYNADRQSELVGEAYFKVAKNPEHPFTIRSGGMTVTVFGTEFNLRAVAGETRSILSLYSGTVEIGYADARHRLDDARQEIVLDLLTAEADIHAFDTSLRPEWLAAESASRPMPLSEIFGEIEAAYGVTITGKEAADPTGRYRFRLDPGASLDAVMASLAYAGGEFDYTIQGNTIRLEPLHPNSNR